MSNLIEWEEIEDEYGIYKTRTNEFGIVEKLTTYKQRWYDENPPQEPTPQPPTVEEQLAAQKAEFDVAIIELWETVLG